MTAPEPRGAGDVSLDDGEQEARSAFAAWFLSSDDWQREQQAFTRGWDAGYAAGVKEALESVGRWDNTRVVRAVPTEGNGANTP
jgi:hypothetical protein